MVHETLMLPPLIIVLLIVKDSLGHNFPRRTKQIRGNLAAIVTQNPISDAATVDMHNTVH
jgi:hypothetical protein